MRKNKFTPSEGALLKRIGKNIKEARKKVDLGQEELAYNSKIDRAYMGNIERGETNVTVLLLKKAADTMGVDISELFKIKSK